MKIAAAYIRVSDERQDEYSPESQLKLIRDFAKRNDFIVPEEYVFFDDGISAKSTKKRDRFNEMIGIAKTKPQPFEAILVWKFSRFARNQEQSIVYKSLLKKNNIDVLSISEPISSDPFGSLIERIIEWMDEYYLIRLSGEVKRGMTEKASRGEAMCHPAFGFDLKNKCYYPNEYADTVRMIFNDYINGIGMRTIAKKLNSLGIKTTRGGTFDNRHIEYILNNPVYNGKIRWSTDGRAASNRDYNNPNTMIVDGKHDAIIDNETWERTQQRLKEQERMYPKFQRRDQNTEWMLKGLVRCSACGATLTMAGTKCMSMQCHRYARGQCETSHSLSVAKADKAVIQALEEAVGNLQFNVVPIPTDRKSNCIDYQALIDQEHRKLLRCKDSYIAGIDTIEEYKANKEKISKEIEALKEKAAADKQKTSLPTTAQYAEKVRNVIDILKNDTVTARLKNEALRAIIAHIVYEKPEGNLKLFFYI